MGRLARPFIEIFYSPHPAAGHHQHLRPPTHYPPPQWLLLQGVKEKDREGLSGDAPEAALDTAVSPLAWLG